MTTSRHPSGAPKKPLQLELFADGAQAIATAKRPKPAPPTEESLQARLDAARRRVREIVVLGMKTWLPEETLRGLREAEEFRRRQVRLHFTILERFRAKQRQRGVERTFR